MLPKPYTAELLLTTVGHSIETASMVVHSQRQGTAVPEVIQELAEISLSGDFRHFSLRAVLDFLNNCNALGVLELESHHRRVWIFLSRGRVQGITASGVEVEELSSCLPETLRDLGPVLRLTVGGNGSSQVEGLVQLLDNKVLDPRLLQKLLRYEAAVLLLDCFRRPLKSFRFEPGRIPPPLHHRLALDTSVVALLVEASITQPADRPPHFSDQQLFNRRAIRGQNLDRAGLSASHQRLMSQLSEPVSFQELNTRLEWPPQELDRVLHALTLADLVEAKPLTQGQRVLVLETDPQMLVALRDAANAPGYPFAMKVVRDRLSLQLVLKRSRPDLFVVAMDSEVGVQVVEELMKDPSLQDVIWIGIGSTLPTIGSLSERFHTWLLRPFTPEQFQTTLADAWAHQNQPECVSA
jgi:hypothetical protein